MCSKLVDISTVYSNDPNLKKEDVKKLSKWVLTQPHLPNLEELQIALFLNSCCYDLEFSKTTIENYFKFRNTASIFRGLTEDLVKRILSTSFIGFMPERTPDGSAVFFVNMLDPRPEIYNCAEHNRVIVAIMLLYLHQHGPANGLVVVLDMKDAALGHLFKMNISTLRQMAYFVQEAAPMRIKSIHNIYSKSLTRRIMALCKPFLKKELYDMIQFHGDPESLYEHIPRECFMEDYGGLLPSLAEMHARNVKNVLENLDILRWHDTQKLDETKRGKKGRGFFGSIHQTFGS